MWYDTVEKHLKKISALLDMGTAFDREKWKSVLKVVIILMD